MHTRTFLVGCSLLAASFSPALADSMTGSVRAWDSVARTITLDDQSQFANIAKDVAVPHDLKEGDEITVDYYADEDGIQAIHSIMLNREIAKRLPPPVEKRG